MPWWLTVIIWSAVFVVSELIRPKPRFENARPSGLGDFNFPTATEGRSVPLIWGTVRIKGPNVVWYGGLRQTRITEEVSTGLFSSDEVTTGYRYYVGIMFALCRGPVDACTGVFINDKLADGGRNGAGALSINAALIQGGEQFGSGGVTGDGTFYVGDNTQVANPYLASVLGSTPPAFRGTCYYIFEGGYVGTSPNIQPWAFDIRRIPDGLSLSTESPGDELVNGTDANPMNVIYEILTDTDWGLKISSSEIDITSFRAAAVTLANEGNGFSFTLDNEINASDLLTEVQRQIDGALYFDRTTGQWKMTLIRDDYVVASLPSFDESNIVEVRDFSRTTWWETVNQVRLQFNDIDDQFKSTFALAQDMANVELQGGNVSVDVRYPGVKHRELANSLCWRELSTLAYPLAKATLVMNRLGFQLKPGDAFKWSNEELDIVDLVMRITRINYGTLDSGTVSVTVTQDIFTTPGAGTFGDPTSTGWTDPQVSAVPVVSADTLTFEAPRQLVTQDTYAPAQQPRVWLGARNPGGGTVGFEVWSRFGTSRPLAGSFEQDTDIGRFLIAGKLESDLAAYGATAARPDTGTSIAVLEDPDTLEDIITGLFGFWNSSSGIDGLRNLVYVDGEFIGFEVATTGTGKITLTKIYRGLFHTAPKAHAANTRVWFIGQGGGNLSRTAYAEDQDEIDYKLRSVSSAFIVAEIDTPTEEVTLNADRIWSVPLAPRDPIINGTFADTTVSLDTSYTSETGLTGDDALAVEVEVTPRDWRVNDVLEDHLLLSTYLSDLPNFDFILILDPTGTPAPTAAVNVSSTDEPVAYILRNAIIEALGSSRVIPGTATLSVTAKHTPPEVGVEVTNPVPMELDLTITSALQGADDVVFGAFDVNVISDVVVFGETGTYAFDIKTALPSSGILEGRINGGGFSTIVSVGNTTGNLTGVTAGDDVELRFTQAPADDQFFDITGPTSELGYGVLKA